MSLIVVDRRVFCDRKMSVVQITYAGERVLRTLDVVGEQSVLIADVQPAVAHNWMRPARVALVGNAETSLLTVAGRRGFGEPDNVVLALNIKMPVCERHRSLADAAIPPHHLAGREVEAYQDRIVEPVEVAVHENDPAVVILHVVGEVHLFGPD